MPRLKDSPARLWFAVDCVLAAAAYVAAAYLYVEVDLSLFLLYEGGLTSIALIAAAIVLGSSVQGLYSAPRLRSRVALVFDLTAVIGFAFVLQAVIHYVDRNLALPLPVMLTGSALAFLALFAWRLLFLGSFEPERILLVGATALNRKIAAQLVASPWRGMAAIGYLDDAAAPGAVLDGVAVLGSVRDLPQVWKDREPHRVVIDQEGGDGPLDPALVKHIVTRGLLVQKPNVLYETLFGRILAVQIQSSAAFLGGELAPSPARLAMQAIYNNVIGLAALVAAAPLMAVIAVLVKATSPGPVFEKRRVVGWNLIPFTLLRFRSDGTGRIGRWFRGLRLDGLPQLWNVARGEMSLAGPRPAPAEAAENLLDTLPCYRLRFAVKPGITGWSQIYMPPGADAATELEYDLYYVKHLSMALDCYILLNVFRPSRGADEAEAAPAIGAAQGKL
jgi:lipopolysaccharide/colanic/teichoic acid biosynthesis glycosyltransferase